MDDVVTHLLASCDAEGTDRASGGGAALHRCKSGGSTIILISLGV